MSLNKEKVCREISETKIAVCEKTQGLRSGNFSDLNSACSTVLVPVKIFQFRDMHYENRSLGTFQGHSKRPTMNAVQDRVTENALDNLRPIKSIMKMENKEFLPSFHDNQDLLHDFIPLFARVLVDKIPAMQTFKSVVVKHIPHKYSNEMKKKTTQVLSS